MQIRILPDALRSAAQKQQDIIGNIAEETSKITELSNQLSDAWEGASGSQACNALAEIRAGIKNIIDGASNNARKLISIADAFESIDGGESNIAVQVLPLKALVMPIRPAFSLSMPGLVRIDPDRVRNIAEQCKVVSNSLSDGVSTFTASVKDLGNNWEGRSYAKFEDETYEIIRAFGEIEEIMTELISRIVNAANRYEEIDNSF